jgi:hypothetical protein
MYSGIESSSGDGKMPESQIDQTKLSHIYLKPAENDFMLLL